MKRTFVSFVVVAAVMAAVAAPAFAQVTVSVPVDTGEVKVDLTDDEVLKAKAYLVASGGPQAFKKLRDEIAAARPTGYYTSRSLGEAAQLFADRQVLLAAGGDSTSVAWIAYQQAKRTEAVRKAAGNQFVAALIQGAMNGAGSAELRVEVDSLKTRLDNMVSREEVAQIAAEAAAKAAEEEGNRIRAWAQGQFKTR